MARIAIVDDAALARAVVMACLSGTGHELLEVDPTSLSEVMEQLRAMDPDLIIVDYLMPNFTGTHLVRTCSGDSILSRAKLLILTAHHDEEMMQTMLRFGAVQIRHKPIDRRDLLDTLEALLHT